MKVTYIYHSGFAVELGHCILLFDYYKGELPEWEEGKPIYIFASHKHQDHFSHKIFDLAKKYEKVHFYFGSDIKLSEKYLERNGIPAAMKEKITRVAKRGVLEENGLWIKSLRSTDEGVAFLVRAEGKLIYHAGDLNWWHWEGEPSPFNENMERDNKKEIDSVTGYAADIEFVPLDPRLEGAFGWGMDYFLEKVGAKYVFPMHMWEEYGIIRRYKETEAGKKYQERIADIYQAGQEFKLWNI